MGAVQLDKLRPGCHRKRQACGVLYHRVTFTTTVEEIGFSAWNEVVVRGSYTLVAIQRNEVNTPLARNRLSETLVPRKIRADRSRSTDHFATWQRTVP